MRPTLTHLALHVPDVEACVRFYERHCGLRVTHERPATDPSRRIVWMAEPGKETTFVFVFLPGGPGRGTNSGELTHLGFALASRDEVDAAARRGAEDGCLVWKPRQEPPPVGYYCGLVDPAGNLVEFSYGQPLGPQGDSLDANRGDSVSD